MIERLLAWLTKQIVIHDRMVDDTEFALDREIYNYAAHLLRRVRDEIKRLEKEDA